MNIGNFRSAACGLLLLGALGLLGGCSDQKEQEEKGADDAPQETDHDAPAEEPQAADDAPAEKEAGPVIPPTSERMALLRKLEIELLEVEK